MALERLPRSRPPPSGASATVCSLAPRALDSRLRNSPGQRAAAALQAGGPGAPLPTGRGAWEGQPALPLLR